ncbi:MAG TPA: sialate O-acetylesterase [Edaphobacter sp.]|jgi:sialate O-acetylesterase|nr:sialate O-acetylesterase [Edaphobacter sp.]
MRRLYFLFALLFISISPTQISRAQVRLPGVLSDHAVLQRDRPARIWGWASPGEKISVRFHNQSLTAEADDVGEWQVWLKPEAVGGPYTLTVTSEKTTTTLERRDILLGDVWIASGQSNMGMPLKGFNPSTLVKDGEKEIAAAAHPQLRLLVQKEVTSGTPLSDSTDVWSECTPETARDFSAVAYFFGRELSRTEKVPIGLIETTWGGTPAHAWISLDSIINANLTSVATDAINIARDQAKADSIRAVYNREDEAAKVAGQSMPKHPAIPNDHKGAWAPGALYNAMISPYTHYVIKGIIWYQGETDADPARAAYYERVFPTLITDWRRQWAQGDFPFLFVQISSFTSPPDLWGQVRDAQRRTLSLANTGMAVSLDVGLAKDIHPPNKQTVAARLAANARAIAYGEHIEYSSPQFLQATPEGSSIRAWFTHADGLSTPDQQLGDVEVAGEDRKFVPANARIETIEERKTIVATARSVVVPRYIRYGWAGVVTHFVYNAGNFPLGSFTSE